MTTHQPKHTDDLEADKALAQLGKDLADDLEQGHFSMADAISMMRGLSERLRRAALRPAGVGETDRIGTHSPSCWSFGPRHYECALNEIERLLPTTPTKGAASDV